jgi:hypothetical protein
MSGEAAWEAAGRNIPADAPPAAWEAGPSKKPTPERLCWRMKEILECTLIQGDRKGSPLL